MVTDTDTGQVQRIIAKVDAALVEFGRKQLAEASDVVDVLLDIRRLAAELAPASAAS